MRRMLIALGLIAGCATAPPPSDRVVSSEASIRAAEETGARNVPSAALHLQLAYEEAARGKQLIQERDNARARTMLMRAEADAELALALAREDSMRAQAQQAVDQVRALQQM